MLLRKGAGFDTSWYDANGNQTQRAVAAGTYVLTYNVENQLVRVSGPATAAFGYDGDGKLVTATTSGTTTFYVGNYYEKTGSTVRKYYYHAGRRVAMRENGVLSWLLTDQLGSRAMTLTASAGITGELRYREASPKRSEGGKAYGETRYTYGVPSTKYRFTGQREESTIGLYFYNVRWYDAVLGRFVQADTIVPEPGNPQALNRYSYALSNPLKYTDPSGHAVFVDTEAEVVVDRASGRLRPRNGLARAQRSVLRDLGRVNDLEGQATISDLTASVYPEWGEFLPEMGEAFVGTRTTGPTALAAAALAGGCAGLGREPRDCPSNEYYFGDTGFHRDFRDTHNQPYHVWGYIAQTATPGTPGDYGAGVIVGIAGNVFHEMVQSALGDSPLGLFEQGWGTSWQDYALSVAGMEIGASITSQAITPAELGDVMRYRLGPQGPGSRGMRQFLEQAFGPLAGSRRP